MKLGSLVLVASTATAHYVVSPRDIQAGRPNPAPAGYGQYTSPIVVPSPPASNATGDHYWNDAVNKATAFVNQLTLPELINMTTGAGINDRCVGNTGAIPRLGFPGLCLEDSPTGVRFTDFASAYPAAINVASTWDRDLAYRQGVAMGSEHRNKGTNVQLGPMMNLLRTPEAGRNWEGFGAEPFLTGVCAAETIQGIQSVGVIACAKHFIGNEQEHFRGGGGATASSSNIDDRTLRELYLWPFAESIRAGVGSVMCSYNRINQTYACENSFLINGVVKGELGFNGFVVSDWAATESGVNSALAGLDMNMPGFFSYDNTSEPNPATSNNSHWGLALIQAVNNGSVPLARVQDMAIRTMAAYYKMGQDSPDYPKLNFNQLNEDTIINGQLANEHVNVQADHYKLIREVGAASTVLLKNVDHTLPLDAAKIRRWAIFGSDAGPNPDGPNGCRDRGCDQGTLAMGWGSGTANFPYLVDPLSAISHYIRSIRPTAVIEGILSDYNYPAIATVARQADACLVFANADSGEGYITVSGNAGDRNNLTLWHGGDALIANVTSQCANTIVVLHTVGAVIMESWIDHPNVTAVLYAGLPGQESGNAIVDVLFGHVNPSARLPYTIAKQATDYPAAILYVSNATVPQIDYSEQLLIDYRWFDSKNITPRFEFGYGLSYTQFSYNKLNIFSTHHNDRRAAWADYDETSAPGGAATLYEDVMSVAFSVQNTGDYDGHEVSQVYLGFPASANEPPKMLRGFQRTYLKKGHSSVVTIALNRKALSIWDVVRQQWTVPTGTFTVFVGQSSRNIKLTGTFTQ